MKLACGALFAGLLAACGGGGEKPVRLTDSSIPDGTSVCSPLTQAGCAAGEKCAWIEDQANPPIGHIGCAADGTVAAGGACTVGAPGATGYSNCVKGTECVAGTCKSICDHQGGAPKCGAEYSCSRYDGLFESGEVTVAGVCDPKCDPLTQELLVGTNKAACGSTNPAMPTAGCFTFDGIDYTCAPVGMSTLALTDRQPARGPASGGAYVNGCAPGFLPFFREMTGSTTTVCAGMCAPLKTDNTLRANVIGSDAVPAKLPTKAAPVAGDAQCIPGEKGFYAPGANFATAQNCLFMWPFNVENGMLPATPYNDNLGICFAAKNAIYTYDHDNNAGTPARPVPGCQDLPPRIPCGAGDSCPTGLSCAASKVCVPAGVTCTAAAGCSCTIVAGTNFCAGDARGYEDGLASEWGCYNTTDSGLMAAFTSIKGPAPTVKPFLKEFNVGGRGVGTGVRHRIIQ